MVNIVTDLLGLLNLAVGHSQPSKNQLIGWPTLYIVLERIL